ncbi:MAG: hypothetical protein HYW89_02460 [Candidatus Sungiibacteriota bacterium]|uniref:Uncharacterized protein n=1 Tax=Candidatus Sungiibacteriota bacterium TaxID=2750080 RepID=A0A7T5UR13_9BACT|nr:MAG: hypothetical protein HYW89_02460 [Candidatus Sungbacteria bacterium]
MTKTDAPQLEADLRYQATIHYVDEAGYPHVARGRRLAEPFIVGQDEHGRHVAIPMEAIRSIDVDDELVVGGLWEPLRRETTIVAHWRSAPWGELVRLTP